MSIQNEAYGLKLLRYPFNLYRLVLQTRVTYAKKHKNKLEEADE